MWASPRYAIDVFILLDQIATQECKQLEGKIEEMKGQIEEQNAVINDMNDMIEDQNGQIKQITITINKQKPWY